MKDLKLSSSPMKYFVYILRTSSNTLYTGQTSNLEKRLEQHRSKTVKSSRYMRSFSSFELVYSEACESRGEALKREYEIKGWTKAKKEEFLKSI